MIDPAIENEARRRAHLAARDAGRAHLAIRDAHLLRAVIAELDDTRRHLLDAHVELDQAQAHALETERRRCLGGMPRESTTDWANQRLVGGSEAEYAHLNGWRT